MKNKGIAITVMAAVFWGFSGACAQYIFDTFHADPVHLTAVRISCAGIALTFFGMLKDPDNMKSIWKDRPMVIRLFIFGVAGLMFCQITYMLAISYTNSGTATILQYIGPVLVMIVSCLMARRLPRGKEVLAILLARPTDVLCLGEETARSLGLRVGLTRFFLILLSCVLAGAAVSFSGLVSFVGLLVPHIVRRLFGQGKHLVLLPAAAAIFSTAKDSGRFSAQPMGIADPFIRTMAD